MIFALSQKYFNKSPGLSDFVKALLHKVKRRGKLGMISAAPPLISSPNPYFVKTLPTGVERNKKLG
jgi:hypothetical protein